MVAIGVDAGTSQVKAVRFGDDLVPQAQASVTTAVRRGRPGWAEQDMDEVWSAVASVVGDVVPDDGEGTQRLLDVLQRLLERAHDVSVRGYQHARRFGHI